MPSRGNLWMRLEGLSVNCFWKMVVRLAICSSAGGALVGPAAGVELAGVTSATLVWEAASGPVAGYYVMVSRDGGPVSTESFSGETVATVSGDVGETLIVQTSAFGSDGVVGPSSVPSEPITFAAPVDSGCF